jgi:hypothetical protein
VWSLSNGNPDHPLRGKRKSIFALTGSNALYDYNKADSTTLSSFIASAKLLKESELTTDPHNKL